MPEDLKYTERAGYRYNSAQASKNAAKNGNVTVYAERRNLTAALGEYGGDAYPIAADFDANGYHYGIVLAADGVGQGGYPHPSLKKILEEKLGEHAAPEGPARDRALLALFLRLLYGAEIFSKRNQDALDYALRCFSDVPADGFFVTEKELWENPEAQVMLPFYERDSQSLGSRIVCVGLYLKFRHYLRDHNIETGWDPAEAEVLREEVEGYLSGLSEKIGELFPYEDAPGDKANRYFLPSTVAAWFYIERDGSVSALSLNMGDCRCYIANLKDGVRQISIDDAFADGSMSAFVHFGKEPRTGGEYHDGSFHARIVNLNAPCALIACSDGVYDTCPGRGAISDGKKYSLPYGDTMDSSDFLFEKNLLEALRRCYSFEDFRREIVYNFYAQSSARAGMETCEGGNYPLIKRDDSGTLAARFFGKKSVTLFGELRKERDTTLDLLYKEIVRRHEIYQKGGREGYYNLRIPYAPLHFRSAEVELDSKREDYATREFKNAVVGQLKADYPAAFRSMKEAGAKTLWGVEHGETELKGFSIGKMFTYGNMIKIFACAEEDWRNLGSEGGKRTVPAKWKKHEHVVSSSAMIDLLLAEGFDRKLEELSAPQEDPETAAMLKLYAWFVSCFWGDLPEGNEVLKASDGVRREVVAEDVDEILRIPAKPAPVPAETEKTEEATAPEAPETESEAGMSETPAAESVPEAPAGPAPAEEPAEPAPVEKPAEEPKKPAPVEKPAEEPKKPAPAPAKKEAPAEKPARKEPEEREKGVTAPLRRSAEEGADEEAVFDRDPEDPMGYVPFTEKKAGRSEKPKK